MEESIMAVKFAESFDDGLYDQRLGASSSFTTSASYGLHGDGARLGDTPNGYLYPPVDGSETAILGFAMKIVTAGSGNGILAYLGPACLIYYDQSNQRLHGEIRVGVSSYVDVYTATGSVVVGKWVFVEVKFYPNTGSAGTFQMGVTGTYTSEETSLDYFLAYDETRIGWTTSEVVADFYIDDLYIADTNGGVNDDFLGPCLANPKLPNGNGNSSDLVGQDADQVDNYLNVDENPPDESTTYNESGTQGHKDTYAFEDTTGAPTIVAVVGTMYAKRTQTGVKHIRAVTRVGSTDYVGSEQALAEDNTPIEEVWDVDPATSSAWLYTAVDAAEFGAEVRD
jgi:hypothetical protein